MYHSPLTATGKADAGGGIISYEANGYQCIAVVSAMTATIWPTRTVNVRPIVYGLGA